MKCSWFSREGLTAALPPNVEAGRMAGIIRGTLLGAVFGGGSILAPARTTERFRTGSHSIKL